MNSYSARVETESGTTTRVSTPPRWEQQKEHSSPQHSMDQVIEYRFVNYGTPSALFRACAHSQPLAVLARRAALEMCIHFHRYWIRLSAVSHSFGLNGECAKHQKPKPFADGNGNRVQYFLLFDSAAFFRARSLSFVPFCCCCRNCKYISIQFHICTSWWLGDVLIAARRRVFADQFFPIYCRLFFGNC